MATASPNNRAKETKQTSANNMAKDDEWSSASSVATDFTQAKAKKRKRSRKKKSQVSPPEQAPANASRIRMDNNETISSNSPMDFPSLNTNVNAASRTLPSAPQPIINASTFSYKDALLQKPVMKVAPLTQNRCTESPAKSPPKQPKLKSKVKQKIDQMLSDVGGAFLFLCGKCFTGRSPRMKIKSSKGPFCDSPDRHPWEINKVMVHRSPKKPFPLVIRHRPKELHAYIHAKMCPFAFSCRFGVRCRCAHNPIEIKVWNLGSVSHDDIVKRCAVDTPPTGFCCSLCNRVFQVKWELENHTNTQEHKTNMTLDQERPWVYREPLITSSMESICYVQDWFNTVKNIGGCIFSDAVPSENACTKAHSVEELEEWRERHGYRQMKLLKAKQQNIFSFMDDLHSECAATDSEIDVISHAVPKGVRVDCDNNSEQYVKATTDGMYQFKWTFKVYCTDKKQLVRVGLLYDEYRVHFCLSSPKNVKDPQVCPGSKICSPDSNDYNINVLFKTKIRGRYEQWAIFDFGDKPVVKSELIVHAGVADNDITPDETPESISNIVWDGSNTKIIPFFEEREDEMKKLEIKYKLTDFQVSLEKNFTELTRDNYKMTMDQLLRVEEKARQEKLSKFCMETVLETSNSIILDVAAGSSAMYAQGGNLFGKIHTTQSAVFDDSDASQIALSSVKIILIKFNPKSSKVYEAQIVMDEADGRTRDALYVRLTAKCVQEMKLMAGKKVKVEIQFRLDRLHFCIMRWAVDQLICTTILFPTKNEYPALICPQTPGPGSKFNRLQEGAVRFLREKGGLNSKTPLLLLYGPFGTGKTYTLANGIMSALTDTDTRILICTHTNSAADLYITEYLDSFVTNWKCNQFQKFQMDMLRVYATDRDVRTIPLIVQKYMLFDEKYGSIKKIDEWDIRGKRIVITTTSSAAQFAAFPRMRGYFTHILIDEAAQVLETEAIIPLILSMPNTCIVLAGDHIQMGPRVYSSEGRDAKFHKSLLERLFEHCLRNRCHRQILLRNNYRTHEDILSFLSKVFYSAEDMEACGNQPRHPLYYPLEFRAVNGYDMVVGNSYVNRYEVLEAVTRVQEILTNWPDDWPVDEMDPQEQIGVFAPYRAQVQQLRREFRIRNLSRVFVDSLQGVQGKQFRVIIISTVRTQKTINKKDADDQDTQYYLGFLSDLRQLNTAFTRAQSLVVVVGNPTALCSLGECCNVWKKYIKVCEVNQSLYPKGTAYQDIRLAISAATTTLDPNAASFIPIGSAVESSYPHSLDVGQNQQVMQNDTGVDSDDDVVEFNTDDLILQELRRQLRRDRRRQDRDDDDDDSSDENTDEEIQLASAFRMLEEDDHVRVIEEDDGDEHPSRSRQEIATGKTISCIFHMDLDGRRYAIPTDAANDEITEITIGNHSQRGTAMDGDEVTVEILANDDDYDVQTTEELNKVYGKVINVDKLAVDYTNKELVCLADPYSDNLMVPVNQRLPKIMIIRPGIKYKGGGKRPSGHLVVPICRVINRNGRDQTQRERDVVVSNKDRPHKLFKVKWLRWNKQHHYPIGFVVDELPAGDNKEDGVEILKQVYEVQLQKDSVDLVQEYPMDWQIPPDEYRRRSDLRDLLVFTIDPPNSEDLDDGLSVQKHEKGYVVGVHIADVSYFVNRETKLGQSLDSKARRMATSFYPASEKPIHMLPLRLSTDLCSLKPGQDKLAISVFLVFDETGKRIPNETRIMRSIIHSNIRLTYDDAEQVLGDNHELVWMEELKKSLHVLSCISCTCRKARLGNAAFSQLRGDTLSHPLAHIMVEEMMIVANETAARFLISQLPQCTPLRRQLPPILENFRSWKESNQGVIDESSYLTHAKETFQSVLNDTSDNSEDRMVTLDLLHDIWYQIKQCVAEENIFRLGGLVCTDQYHPQLAAAQSVLHRILFNGEYVNSGDHASGARIHSSLAKSAYTHFTSPIRRYIDIVVHRLLIAALNKDESLPHDAQDVTKICHTCNIRSFAAREFELKTHALELALQLKQRPMQVRGVIETLSDKNLQLGFNHDDRVNEALRKSKVAFNLLKPVKKPEVEEGEKTVTMKWEERVYHVGGMPPLTPNDIRANQARAKEVQLQVDNNHKYTVKVPTHNWRCINVALAEGNRDEVKRQIRALDNTVSTTRPIQLRAMEDPRGLTFVEDITCETDDDISCETDDESKKKKKKHYASFQHTFIIGKVTQVQLYPTFNRGILAPNVQLYQMTPTLHFCMEHRGQPVQCLSTVADHMPKRKDIKTYQETWLPLLDMMAAYNAVQQNDTVIIHGVNIDWQHHSSDPLPNGSFTLTKTFCNDRNIDISQVKASGRRAAFLCIRFHEEVKVTAQETDKNQDMIIVAHGSAFVSDAKENKETDPENQRINVFFEVNQMSAPFPKRLRKSSEPENYTVEIIPVCYPDSRLEGAVKDVDSSSSLVQNICLLTPDKAEYDSDRDASDMKILIAAAEEYGGSFDVPACQLKRLNRPQSEAVEKALTQRFTLIQGPPGTGKTVTGAYLSYFFSEQNKQLPTRGKRPQILYCGPSNKSVDVIAEYLKNFPISIVRAYGKEIEYREFPIPGLPRTGGKIGQKDVSMDPRHESISLHHLIRMKTRTDGLKPNSKAEAILEYDRRFRIRNYEPERREIRAYLKLIFAAEIEELEKYQVILTTCNASGSGRITEGTNIIQCIVDEAGMCNEPETLIPLVSTKPLQIVLIGDHKQLRPIIPEPTARLLGMEISLLQRYAKHVKMLTIQYRMHEAICRFPSMTFYDNRLVTPPVIKKRLPPIMLRGVWPGDGSQPMAFCHCSGVEETLSVKTAEGNEMSKANLYEVQQVVRIANVLVDTYKVNPKEIVVLSQYRLQCDKITTKLRECGRSDIDVRTVIKSQGSEWNYVLMSTVRSLPRVEIEEKPNFGWRKKYLGFITDENQMNVALTRAKHGLIIVGNKYLLRTHKLWKELLDYYEEKKCLVIAKQFLLQRGSRRSPRY
ncbi:3'-5' exoribonuclease HELZ2-like [Amphiura filiformis]|uniref:3'-5' exoribonuclease HELZ2-like n=1 Tax=Amphiura filiformis TaxID=82378 RepID=UPI003B20C600